MSSYPSAMLAQAFSVARSLWNVSKRCTAGPLGLYDRPVPLKALYDGSEEARGPSYRDALGWYARDCNSESGR